MSGDVTNEVPNKDIALKAWEIYQELAKGMGDSAWKIRSLYFSLSAAIISFAYTSRSAYLYLLVPVLAVLFMFLESGYRRLQDQYIQKSNQIELTLNDFIAGEDSPRFPDSIGTDLETPSFRELAKMFCLKRAMFWGPYAVLFFASIALSISNFTK